MVSQLPRAPFDCVLVGAGRVGTAVALLLQSKGHNVVAVSSRSRDSAAAAAERLGAPVTSPDDLPAADLYLIGTPAASLPEIGRSLVATNRVSGSVLVHFAGAVGIEPLRECSDRGAFVGALHPVQACPDVDSARRNLPHSAWGITCTDGLDVWAKRLVEEDLEGRAVAVAEKDRPLWHAGAVITSNGIAALLAAGEALLGDLGVEAPEAVLGPLAAGTIANARSGGGGAATLTGPLVRGEVDTIADHLGQLEALDPNHSRNYRLASQLILSAIRARGGGATGAAIEALVQP
ncbi:MAG TPA: DUF2520 domain-containing protein [Actinomycetota bacterium]|nr:DUF2520 domain-containing protein [Actinomycetota bacterium]